MTQQSSVSARTILKVLSLTAGFVLLLMVAYMTRRELVWIGVAFFLAVALNPAVDWFVRRARMNRGLAAGAVFAGMLAVFAFIAVTLVPPVIRQSEQLVTNVPGYASELVNGNTVISRQVRSLGLANEIQSSQNELLHYATGAGGSVFKIVQGIFSSFAAGITIIFLTYFMLLEGPGWLAQFWRLVPERRREHGQHLAAQMYRAVTGYVTGNLLTSLLVALLVATMLTLVRVPFAVPLGILVGLFDLLPLVGATIGAIVVVAAALFASFAAAVIMTIFFVVYQQIENHVLQPIIYGRTVQMSPLTVLVSILLGAGLAGIIGAIVAIPVGASVQILLKDFVATRSKDQPPAH